MFNHNPMMTMVSHAGQPASRAPSPALWNRARGQMFSPDGVSRFSLYGDDFRCFGGTVTSNVGNYSGQVHYTSYEDSGDSIAQVATDANGAIDMTTDATDNDEVWMQPGGTASVLAAISDTSGSDKLLIFEARVKFSAVDDNSNWLVGMSEEGLAAADTVADAGTMASKDFIGWGVLEDDGDALRFFYRKAGQAMQTVLTYGTAFAVDTYYKLGFVYDPEAEDAKKIKLYVNGVEQTTYVTATNIAAATFPDGEELNVLLGLKNGDASANTLTVDWWAVGVAG